MLDGSNVGFRPPNLATETTVLGRPLLPGERRRGAGILLIVDGHRSTTRRTARPPTPKTHVGHQQPVTNDWCREGSRGIVARALHQRCSTIPMNRGIVSDKGNSRVCLSNAR
jgi:hypothetical protein